MADKSFDWRMQGMIYACKIAKEKGVEYLEKDIKRRGVLKADIIYICSPNNPTGAVYNKEQLKK